jgi:hypothetical protein
VLVPVRDYNTLSHLDRVLEVTNSEERDIVVITVRLMTGPDSGERNLYDANLFTDYEQRLFTKVVALAEKHGKPVNLVVCSIDIIYDAIAQTAIQLDSAEIVLGLSAKETAQEQSQTLGPAWERLAGQRHRKVCFKVHRPGQSGGDLRSWSAPAPLTEEDINLIHRIWLEVSTLPARRKVHHRDVVRVALDGFIATCAARPM